MILAIDHPTLDGTRRLSAQERLEELFNAHRERLFGLALRMTGDREDALDVVQEVFLRAARRVESIPPNDGGAEAWVVRVLVNLVRDRWRRQRRQGRPVAIPTDLPAPGSSCSATLARTVVQEALGELTPRRRAIVVLAELEGRTGAEIGDLLGMRAVTVRWHLSIARKQLAQRLRHANGDRQTEGERS